MTKARPRQAGIYVILCEPTGEQYIGASAHLRMRKVVHFSSLRVGRHLCGRLQALYAAHGEESLRWRVLERVPLGPGLDAALRAAEIRHSTAARKRIGDRLISRIDLPYCGRSGNGGPTIGEMLARFRRFCLERGLDQRVEYQVALGSHMERVAARAKRPGWPKGKSRKRGKGAR